MLNLRLTMLGQWILSLSALVQVNGAATGPSNITSDTYFYGQSPPVYPTRRLCLDYLNVSAAKSQTLLENPAKELELDIGNVSHLNRVLTPVQQRVQARAAGQQHMPKPQLLWRR